MKNSNFYPITLIPIILILSILSVLIIESVFCPCFLLAAEKSVSLPSNLPQDRSRVVKRIVCSDSTVLIEYENGMNFFIRNVPYANTGSIRLFVRRTGSINEQELGGAGISYLVSKLLTQGRTKSRSGAEINKKLEALGAVEETFTEYETTGYAIDCPSDNLLDALAVLVDQVQNAELNSEEYTAIKSRLRNEYFAQSNSRDELGRKLLMETCYQRHPIRFPVTGYPDLFRALTLEDVIRFYKSRYCPNNYIFALSGRIDIEKAIVTLGNLFEDWGRMPEVEIPLQYEPNQIASRFSARELDGSKSEIYFSWPTVTCSGQEIFSLELLSAILAEGEGSRLYQKFKVQKHFLHSVESIRCNPQAVQGLFAIHATVFPSEYESFRLAMLEELEDLKKHPVSEEELVRAKKQIEANYLFSNSSLGKILERRMRSYLQTGNPDFDDQFLERIKSVTPAHIAVVVRKFFRSERLSEILICPPGMLPKNVDSKKSPIPKTFTAAISARHFPKNEARLLTKQVPFTGYVNISAFILSGTLLDNDMNAGRSAILSRMLYGGTETNDRSDAVKFFDSIGGRLKVTSGRNTISVSASVLKEDFLKAFRYIVKGLNKPSFSEENFQRAKTEVLNRIRSRKDRTVDEVLAIFSSQLPLTSPFRYLPEGTEDSIGRLTLEQINDFASQVLSSNNMTFTVFGDIEISQVLNDGFPQIELLEKSRQHPQVSFKRENMLEKPIDVHQQSNKPVAAGLIAWPTVRVQSEKEYAAFLIMEYYLSGRNGRNGVLTRKLVDQGLAYWCQTKQIASPTPAYFYVYFETIPEKLNETVEAVDDEIRSIRQGGISSEDFDRTRRELIAALPMSVQTIEEEAQQAALDDLYLNDFNKFYKLGKTIDGITLEFFLETVRRYTEQNNIIVTTSNQKKR